MIFAIFFISCICNAYASKIPSLRCDLGCKSQIYCRDSDFLRDVQLAQVYNTSKEFVDKKILSSEETVLANYQQLKISNPTPTKQQWREFLQQHFAEDPLEKCDLPDFNENPLFLERVSDENYKKWIRQVIKLWKDLGGKVPADVAQHPERHSYIYMPNCFIKAGGFFTEMYYWDTYWIIRGLLLSDMRTTVRGILENFFHLIHQFGYMPNANRVYYIGRSQPPLLTRMVDAYYTTTKDEQFLIQNLQILEKEFEWWQKHRMVDVEKNGRTYRLARYHTEICMPGPEGFLDAHLLGKQLDNDIERHRLNIAIRSDAESGWDHSSRQMRPGLRSPDPNSLLNLDTQNFIMVDLNAFLHYNVAKLAQWYRCLNNEQKASHYEKIANNLFDAIQEVLWNEEDGIWYNWDLVTKTQRKTFYPSNFAPLWTQSFEKCQIHPDKILKYLVRENIISDTYQPLYYGVPTSRCNTTQQWDFTNAWAPLQSIMIEGLRNIEHPETDALAFAWSALWLKTNYEGFRKSGYMYEKYSTTLLGESGNGGGYEPQMGFGWTNGISMILLDLYGDKVGSDDFRDFKPKLPLPDCPK